MEGQKLQWPKRKWTNNDLEIIAHKAKDRVTRAPLNCGGGGEPMSSRRVSSTCSISGTCRVTLVTNPMKSHEQGKDRKVFTTCETYPLSFVTQMFCNG